MNATNTTSPNPSVVPNEALGDPYFPPDWHIPIQLFVSVVSMALSLLLIVAISLPLLLEPQKRTRAQSFNLYLVFLSAADLLFCAIGAVVSLLVSRWAWEGIDDENEIAAKLVESMNAPWCIFLNDIAIMTMTWVVALVSHEILILLRNSKNRKRSKPPALKTAALQGMVGCAVGFVLAAIDLAVNIGNDQLVSTSGRGGLFSLFFFLILFGPIFYSLWVFFRVCKEGLMKIGSNVGNRLRVLVIYFLRIFLVYCAFFGCGAVVIVLAAAGMFGLKPFMVIPLFMILWGLQGWASFGVILTKPDVRKMVRDLIVGKPCRRHQTGGRIQTTAAPTRRHPRTPSPMIEESGNHEGEEVKAEHQEDEIEDSHTLQEDYIAREFIRGIVDYLSDTDADTDGNNLDVNGGNGNNGDSNNDVNADNDDANAEDADDVHDEEANK
mmetsp:Transcript_3326/g.7175  ORF Transcript_3326/g.7175 Transcript_3326/m.7175 type:complete len:438 (+) Transcript_3326:149-1462(+)